LNIWVEMAVDEKVDQLLRSAIENKQLIRFIYKNSERIVEPHDYGVQNGIIRLFSWQVGGHSSGRLPGWRMFDVNGIQNCEALKKHFAGNRDVSVKHHRWDEVFIRVAPPSK
jgi:predicted DNA-binding transcriptional regulator YafY